jgi:hypothetical protein
MSLQNLIYRLEHEPQKFSVSRLEYLSAVVLYTSEPIKSKSGPLIKFGSKGNLYIEYDLGKMLKNSSLKGWKLQERFDFSDLKDPHINYGLTSPKGGYLGKILGKAHKIKLKW